VKEVFLRILGICCPKSTTVLPKDQLTDKAERFFVNETLGGNLQFYKKENSLTLSENPITEEFFEDEDYYRMRYRHHGGTGFPKGFIRH